jgi:hypothetical protein
MHDPWLINLVFTSEMSPHPSLYEQNKNIIINVLKMYLNNRINLAQGIAST